MRTIQLIHAAILATVVLAWGSVASAQTQPLPRADVSATIGWLTVDPGLPAGFYSHYGRWESSLFGSVGAGWYWTDHLKTEIDFGAGTESDANLATTLLVDGLPQHRSVQRRFSTRVLGIGQQYQFFRNAWFHPHIAAGANLTWEKRADQRLPFSFYDPVARTSRLVDAGGSEPTRTEFAVKAYVAGGFKAYIARQAFFRTDLRVAFKGGGIDETMLRIGFGADF